MAAKFVLQQHGKDRYLILFQSHSGQVLLTSEVRYKDVALRQIDATRVLARNKQNFELRTAEDGCSYFLIRNARGEVLALSDMYPDAETMLQGVHLVRSIARGAKLEDRTTKQ